MTVINTNVSSLNAQASLTSNARGLGKAMQQLSTGKRINSASDDAAGLAISTRLTAQIRGLNQAVRNANDGISLVQIAEGSSVEITNMLQRMRELAVQSANDTNTDGDRAFLDSEFQQLKEEINRIGNTVEWNGTNILDGTAGTFTFQVGANSQQVIEIDIGDFRTYDSSVTLASASGTTTPSQDFTALDASGVPEESEGVSVTLNVADQQVVYTITADDVTAALASSPTLLSETVSNALAGLMQDRLDEAYGTGVYTVGAGTAGEVDVSATGLPGNATISMSAEVSDGSLSAINGSEINTDATAQAALDAIDLALDVVNEQRANMGATINRLQYAVDNLTNISTRSSEARSRIEDTDYAQATMDLAKRQIIAQAATAMLAQANQQPQQVLTLLK